MNVANFVIGSVAGCGTKVPTGNDNRGLGFVEVGHSDEQGYGRRVDSDEEMNEGKDAGSASRDCPVTGTIS
jgi:hypothetical protein